MFWSKKPTAVAESLVATPHVRVNDRADPELDAAVDALAEILRAQARHAFAVGDDDATAIAAQFERWASHVLVRAAAPGITEAPRMSGLAPREWRRLTQFAAAHAKREQTYVARSVGEAREAIFVLIESFTQTSSTQSRHDLVLRKKLETLKGAVASGSLETLKREAMTVATAVTEALEEQKGLAQRQAAELREKLTTMGEQLEQTRKDADTDALTRLANRRAFDVAGDRAVAVASLLGRPLTMLMVDLDRFKSINDKFGHPAADQVLRNVSDALVRTFPRRSDVVARYGGEEFAIVLSDTDKKDGAMLAERLLRAVRALSIGIGAGAVGITVSVGLAQLKSGESASDVVKRADRALYAAKESGRNRMVDADLLNENGIFKPPAGSPERYEMRATK